MLSRVFCAFRRRFYIYWVYEILTLGLFIRIRLHFNDGVWRCVSRISAQCYCLNQTTSTNSKLEIQSVCEPVPTGRPCVWECVFEYYKIRPMCAGDVRLLRPTWSELHMQSPAEERCPVQQLHGVRRRHLVLVDGEAERLLFPVRIFGDLGPDQRSRLRRKVAVSFYGAVATSES